MAITALPTPPSRTMSSDAFVAAADAFLGALPTFATEANTVALAMNMNSTSDTSATSITIGTGAKTFTVSASKSFLGGMFLVIADTAAPSTNYMIAQVTSYSGVTLVVNVLSVGGSGTKTAWTISQSAPINTTYSEGTWTPAITAATPGDLAVTYSTQRGNYTKIGRQVIAECVLVTSSFTYTTATGEFRISSLPFTASVNPMGDEGPAIVGGYTKANFTAVTASVTASLTYGVIRTGGSGQTVTSFNITDFPSAGSVVIRCQFIYKV